MTYHILLLFLDNTIISISQKLRRNTKYYLKCILLYLLFIIQYEFINQKKLINLRVAKYNFIYKPNQKVHDTKY